MKKAFLIIMPILLIALLATGIWTYNAFFTSKPLSQSELTNLTPDYTPVTQGNWSPWYTDTTGTTTWNPTASFNAHLATIPEQDKAWPVLIDLTLSNPDLFKNKDLARYPDEAEDWDALAALLQTPETTEVINQLTQALNRPVLGCDMHASTDTYEHQARMKNGLEDKNWDPNPNPNPNAMDILLPALGKARNAAQLLKSAAILELINNNPDRFVELVNTMYASASLTNENQLILSQLVELAIRSVSNDLIMWSLEEYPGAFTDQHLASLAATVHNAGIQTFVWEGEALFFRDTFRHIADASGNLNPASFQTMNSGGGVRTIPTNLPDAQLDKSLQRIFYTHQLIVTQAHQRSLIPWDPTLQPSDDLYEQEKSKLNKVGELLMGILIPALDKAAARFQAGAQESIAVQTLIALHRHKLRHNTFPTTLADLDQDLITHAPTDIFTGTDLHYNPSPTNNPQSPLLYALGHDRNDDQGRYIKTVKAVTIPTDADWPMYSDHKLNQLYPEDE